MCELPTPRCLRPLTGLLLIAVLAGPSLANGWLMVDTPPEREPGHQRPGPLPPASLLVHVAITDRLARTTVDQVFSNDGPERLEGTFIFPLPSGATLDRFTMDINGKPVAAEMLDADTARRVYEDIVRRMRDPALLEHFGQGLYRVRVYPIEPRSETRLRVSYTEILPADGDMVAYRFAVNRRANADHPLRRLGVTVEVDATHPLRAIHSPSHAVEVRRHSDRRATVAFETRDTRPEADFHLLLAQSDSTGIGLHLATWNDGRDPDGGAFLLFATPPGPESRAGVMPKDVVFVLDTSGSMADDGKLEQARRALRFCLANLNPADRFNIVRFSTDTEPFATELRPAAEAQGAEVGRFIDAFRPIGGTAIEEALVTSLRFHSGSVSTGRPYHVVFLTDGLPTVGATSDDAILDAFRRAVGDRVVRVFCFGLGDDVNTHLLDRVASQTRAVSQYVQPGEDLELKLSAFFRKISDPVLASPTLTATGSGVRLRFVLPDPLPDLFRGDQLIVLGRYTGHGPAQLTLSGMVDGRPVQVSARIPFARHDLQGDHIPRLWATRRIGRLLDRVRLDGESAELRDEITRLARRYGIVTPHTALLILEDEARRGVPEITRTIQADRSEESIGHHRRIVRESTHRKSGAAAVGASVALRQLQAADRPDQVTEANRSALNRQTESAARRVEETLQSQQSRYIRGRTFYQTPAGWIDADAQAHPDAPRRQVRFASPEYIRLLELHPEAGPWFGLGSRLVLVLAGQIYEIVE